MAQKRDKEETEFKVQEALTLCTPSIPTAAKKFSGADELRSSPERSDLKTGSVSVEDRLSSASSPSPKQRDLDQKSCFPTTTATATADLSEEDSIKQKKREINRCSGCRRKVGLTGFRCRCGEMFCSDHRYSDRHDCSYDYKSVGREAIARENPVVRAAKILKV